MSVLSKSKLLAYRQCPRRLWLEVNRSNLCADSSATAARFRDGHRVGELARQIYDPKNKGALIDIETLGTQGALAQTQQLLTQRRPIFEAGFQAGGARAFTDALLPVRKGNRRLWRIVEVKSSTSIKEYQRDDVAIQFWIAQQTGLPLAGISLAYIDNTWTYAGDGDYSGLLKQEDLTAEAKKRSTEVKKWVAGAQKVLKRNQEPAIRPGCHCTKPYSCGFIDYCRSGEPQVKYPVEWLPNRTKDELKSHIENQGITDMSQVPDDLLNDIQRLVKTHTLSGSAYFDAANAAADLACHRRFPAYFLDFETVNPAVPIWKGARPYQKVPFQFSRHRLDAQGRLTHRAFLDLSGEDPSRPLIQALLAACGESGPIFVYSRFEKTVINDLAKRYAEHARALKALAKRLVDLHPVAAARYYHPDQHGSWSIKAVLPTIAPDLDYVELDGVQDGNMAMKAYQEAIDPATTEARREEIRRQLLAYCKLDTEALVRLWKYFSGQPAGKPRP